MIHAAIEKARARAARLPSDLKASFHDARQKAETTAQASVSFQLDISFVKGYYSGESTVTDKENILIGAGEDCDIVLLDPGIAQHHVSLTPRRSFSQHSVVVSVLANGVQIGDGAPLKSGAVVEVPLPAMLSLGEAQLRLASGKAAQRSVSHRLRRISQSRPLSTRRTAMSGLAAALAVIGLFVIFSDPAPAPLAMSPAVVASVTPSVEKTMDAAKDLQAQLEQTGLAQFLDVSVLQDLSLRVSGRIPESMRREWNQVVLWHDENAGTVPLVPDVTIQAVPTDIPRIRLVSVKPTPFIITGNGQRFELGQSIGASWQLERVTEHWVEVSRDGVVVRVQLDGARS